MRGEVGYVGVHAYPAPAAGNVRDELDRNVEEERLARAAAHDELRLVRLEVVGARLDDLTEPSVAPRDSPSGDFCNWDRVHAQMTSGSASGMRRRRLH